MSEVFGVELDRVRAYLVSSGPLGRSERNTPASNRFHYKSKHGNMTALHYDADFDVIAAVTGQVVESLVPGGSL